MGIPTEVKNNEFRVAITASGVAELTRRGHEVLIQAARPRLSGSTIQSRWRASGLHR